MSAVLRFLHACVFAQIAVHVALASILTTSRFCQPFADHFVPEEQW
jgi:hypothetical protein